MMKNIHFIGNCLGSRQDLISALELHTTSGLDISIDSEYGFSQIPDFINSSFVLPPLRQKRFFNLILLDFFYVTN